MRLKSFQTPLLALALTICLSSTCWGQSEKLSVALQAQSVPAELDVIIRYKQVPALADHQKVVGKAASTGTHSTASRPACIAFRQARSGS